MPAKRTHCHASEGWHPEILKQYYRLDASLRWHDSAQGGLCWYDSVWVGLCWHDTINHQ